MFKQLLDLCAQGKTLSVEQAKALMDEMMMGEANDIQIASLLSMLTLRGETVEELVGFATSLKQHSVSIDHRFTKVIDTCGTGGDGLSTFNISTTTAIVLSASGLKVAKHGNRAISSKSGSADVLERLNIPIQHSPKQAVNALREFNLSFLYAPLYHQSMKHVANARKQLKFKTAFNLLGPLVNPARANAQVIGAYDTKKAEKMAYTYRELGGERALFVTGGEGMDECSITTYTNIFELKNGEIAHYQITPEELGLKRGTLTELEAGNSKESARLIEQVLQGRSNESALNITVLNAAAALYCADEVQSLADGVVYAKEVIASGKAYKQLERLREKEATSC
ncbi:MAG: anthranilate phosphoribosyltransferase [Bacillaceae bacterium]|nr:anthranilate phosphoribosyltransferase [Bacillaceae bacterium]